MCKINEVTAINPTQFQLLSPTRSGQFPIDKRTQINIIYPGDIRLIMLRQADDMLPEMPQADERLKFLEYWVVLPKQNASLEKSPTRTHRTHATTARATQLFASVT